MTTDNIIAAAALVFVPVNVARDLKAKTAKKLAATVHETKYQIRERIAKLDKKDYSLEASEFNDFVK